MKEFTSKEFENIVGNAMSDQERYGTISLLERLGVIAQVGERKRADGKGKPSTVYAAAKDGKDRLDEAFKRLFE